MGNAAIVWTALGIFVLGVRSTPGHAEDAELVSDQASCIEFSQRDNIEQKLVDFDFTSGCKTTQSCSVSWIVRCDGRAKRQRQSATVASGESRSIRATAASCEGEWAIEDPQWNCRTVGK